MGGFIKVVGSIFEAFGTVGVCVFVVGSIAAVAIYSATKKDG
jgi:hypothetical protein